MQATPAEVIAVSDQAYQQFVARCNLAARATPAIGALGISEVLDEVASAAREVFADVLADIRQRLSAEQQGIAAVDIPSTPACAADDDVFWGTAAVVGLATSLFVPMVSSASRTPFDVFTATVSAGRQLAARGLLEAPERNLQFHTDGVVRSGTVRIPNTLCLYNLFISYERPGRFYWLPFAAWPERRRMEELIGVDLPYDFALTPSYFEGADGELEHRGPRHAMAPIFSVGMDGRPAIFFNGEVIRRSDGAECRDAIRQLRQSLESSPGQIAIEQRMRRAIFLNNRAGCHARDVFEVPILGNELTRVHLRIVDSEGAAIPGHAR